MNSTLVDVAGGRSGGAARFRGALWTYLDNYPTVEVTLIGDGRRLSSSWVLERELVRGYQRRVALNNLPFLRPGGENWLLLRNPLHFVRPQEHDTFPKIPVWVRAEIPIVRRLSALADVIVVPSQSMARRIEDVAPSLSSRIVVRHHPLDVSGASMSPPIGPMPSAFILIPMLPSPHKDLGGLIPRVALARDHAALDLQVVATVRERDVAQGLPAGLKGVTFLGPQPPERVLSLTASATVVINGSGMESFSYNLAEARSLGVPIIAPATDLTTEIGGSAAIPVHMDQVGEIADALIHAVSLQVVPDPSPFDPKRYFDWLLGRANS